MKALINPLQQVEHTVAWSGTGTKTDPFRPVQELIANSATICQVQEKSFDVAQPLFWIDCDDTINPNDYWYNTQDQQIYLIQNEPEPQSEGTNGLQSV